MLIGKEADREFRLQIYNAVTKEHTGEFKYTITDEDITNL